MNRSFSWIAVFLLLAVLAVAQEIKRPVFFLRYDGSAGFEEMSPEEVEEEDVAKLEHESQRHKITLRIKEQWSDGFTTNLYTAVSGKFYDDGIGNYTYLYLNPDYVWDVSDRLRWRSEFRSKITWYDQPDSVDLISLLAKTELTFKVLQQLKVTPSFRGVFDLYQNQDKRQQTYTAGLSFESKINPAVRLSGRYRGIVRLHSGADSTASNRFNNEFGINLSWDPNK
ncbi:MAG: hypothetical protein JSV89_15755 [Spirochaetaceae bacterium]|nr:MAG: hypothetical protein JSV89_15755 [Spirochaetaceae bacterium]